MPTDDRNNVAQASSAEWLAGGGEMGELIRSTDWSETPFGPRDRWSLGLRTVVSLVMESRFPMALLWGRELLLLYNDACRVIAGARHPYAFGRSLREVWLETRSVVEPILGAVLERGEARYLEDALIPVNRYGQREEAYFTISCSPARAEDGAVAGILITLLETTGRVRQSRALETERERAAATAEHERELLTRIIDRVPVMVAIYDPALRSFHVNEEFRRVLGWTDEDSRKSDLMALCYPDADDREEARRYMESSEPGWREFEVAAKDGTRVVSSWANVRLPDNTRVGIGIDLRDRKRAEEALRAAFAEADEGRRTLEALMENVPEGISIADAEGVRIRMVSRYGQELLGGSHDGMTAEEVARRWAVYHPDGQRIMAPEELPLVQAIQQGETVRDVEMIEVTSDGRRLDLLCNAAPIRDATGRILGGIVAWRDIAERKQAEKALQEANARLLEADQRKNDFLAVLSHELRNPLSPIRSSVYLLERAAPGSAQAKRAREIIERQAQHMTRLIEDLLDLTRISRGKITLRRERVDLNAVARAAAEDYREQYSRNGIELLFEGAGQPLWVNGDPTRLAQVIGNLLNNAAKFTSRGGSTRLSIEANARGEAVVRVRDDGAGMAPETLSHLFEPFVQAAQTLERTRGGLGLGLALVKGLVEMHGGKVSASSAGEGKGSEFTLTLPLETPARPELAEPPASKQSAGRRRVLVIEDNVDAAESLREVLELDDHDVAVAYSGTEGVEAARRYKPEVIFCDIGLPELDGFGVARALRADPDPNVQKTFLVALTGYALQEDVAKSKEAGFDRHMAKPPSIEAIEKLIAEAPTQAAASP